MRLTPIDVRQQQFATKFRGFDPQEVEAFLEEVAEDLEELQRENTLLKEQLATLEERMRGLEGKERTLHETLVTTQKLAQEYKENARREAELAIREAHLQAEKILEGARAEEAKLLAYVEVLKRERRRLAEELLATLSTYQRRVEEDLKGGGSG